MRNRGEGTGEERTGAHEAVRQGQVPRVTPGTGGYWARREEPTSPSFLASSVISMNFCISEMVGPVKSSTGIIVCFRLGGPINIFLLV